MFEVCESKCNQCLFSENRIVSSARMKQILAECAADDTYFVCHKASIEGKEVCCRGFYDSPLSNEANLIRVSRRMGWVRFVNVPGTETSALTPVKKRKK